MASNFGVHRKAQDNPALDTPNLWLMETGMVQAYPKQSIFKPKRNRFYEPKIKNPQPTLVSVCLEPKENL